VIFAAYKGGHIRCRVNSCTAALHLSLLVLELKPGDEVITSPMTFCADGEHDHTRGGHSVLADVEPGQ